MTDDGRPVARTRGRDTRARLEDHEAISRLAAELLPSLIAKLGATGLGEIEVREGDWRVRLRRPADARADRRPADRSRAQPGHAGHGHAPGAVEVRPASGRSSAPVPVGPGTAADAYGGAPEADQLAEHRAVATSPAVGVFHPRPEISSGTRVRAGDRVGFVDMLGVPQDVVSPVDGLVGASLVESGEAVEYGQELIRIELASAPSRGGGAAPDGGPAPSTAEGPGEAGQAGAVMAGDA